MVEHTERDLESFCELRQRACPVRVEIASIREQLSGNQKAMELAALTLDARLNIMNHIKEQLTKQAQDTIRREEVLLMLEKLSATFDLQIKALPDLLEVIREREGKVLLTLGFALLALAGNFALQLILHMAAKH